MRIRKAVLGFLSLLFGSLFILAAIVDFTGHFFGFKSPWPWYLNVVFVAVGILLLFPDKLGVAAEYAREFLPWHKAGKP